MNLSYLCRSLAVAGLFIAIPASAQDQEDPPAPAPAETPSAPSEPAKAETNPSATPPAEGGETPASDAQSPTRFIPTQKSTADNSATFPVDI